MVTRHDLFRVDWLPGRLVLNTRIPLTLFTEPRTAGPFSSCAVHIYDA